jgi:hypothetical protein
MVEQGVVPGAAAQHLFMPGSFFLPSHDFWRETCSLSGQVLGTMVFRYWGYGSSGRASVSQAQGPSNPSTAKKKKKVLEGQMVVSALYVMGSLFLPFSTIVAVKAA